MNIFSLLRGLPICFGHIFLWTIRCRDLTRTRFLDLLLQNQGEEIVPDIFARFDLRDALVEEAKITKEANTDQLGVRDGDAEFGMPYLVLPAGVFSTTSLKAALHCSL